ncbi:septation protein SepH [uncultured Nocardioides sp.]|uniref:septation protein SepH n=1 Tax=uncultured Nocardioides sp. TaxID=198441 RepID=UPI00260BE83F|nr:septation protein SepH [uncultured Nocardioides sp.]
MAKLTFTGRSRDGKRLLLVDQSGQEHTLAIDPRLRRAVSGAPDSSGPDTSGQLEIPMESTLRPRDIQMRIRAGESPEAVAHAAGTSVEKIMPFAAPVMAERAHVAERALLASVRRRASESGARTLGEAVGAHLRAHDVDPASVEWDAWRREDGRWTLTALYDVGGRIGTATFSHDPRGSFVTLDDDDARWLVGDVTPAAETSATAAPASDDLAAARQRRLTAIGDDLPLGDDAIEMVTAEEPSATPEETTMELSDTGLGAEQPVEAYLDDRGDDRGDREAEDTADEPAATQPEPEPAAETPAEPKPRPAKKRGRASVPSWDEIMFGGGKGD